MKSMIWGGWTGDTSASHPRMLAPEIQRPGFVVRDLLPILERVRLWARGRGIQPFYDWHTPHGTRYKQKVDPYVWSMLPLWLRSECQHQLSAWLRSHPEFVLGVYAYLPATFTEFCREYGPWLDLGARMVTFDEGSGSIDRVYQLAGEIRQRWPGTHVGGEAIAMVNLSGDPALGTVKHEGLDVRQYNPAVFWACMASYYHTFLSRGPVKIPAGANVRVCIDKPELLTTPSGDDLASLLASQGFAVDYWHHVKP